MEVINLRTLMYIWLVFNFEISYPYFVTALFLLVNDSFIILFILILSVLLKYVFYIYNFFIIKLYVSFL